MTSHDFTVYTKQGIAYTRISSLLKFLPNPELDAWRMKVGTAVANREKKRSQQIGHEVDQAITATLRGQLVPKVLKLKPEVVSALAGFHKWHHLNPIQPIALQEPVYDEQLKIAGTPDCVCPEEALDWKATNQLRWENVVQVIAYWPMIEHTYGIKLKQYRLVRFDKFLATWEEKVIPWQPAIHELIQHLVPVYHGWQALTAQLEVV